MKKITLCGSTRFKSQFLEVNKRLSLEGNVVYSVAFFNHTDDEQLRPEQKLLLDKVHIAKIDNSDEIFVIDVDSYIGESTAREIAYAKTSEKFVRYLSKEMPELANSESLISKK